MSHDEDKVLSGRKNVMDGPFAESKEAIAGYWFIQAASLEEAVEIAKGNPCLDYGLTVEVRRSFRKTDRGTKQGGVRDLGRLVCCTERTKPKRVNHRSGRFTDLDR